MSMDIQRGKLIGQQGPGSIYIDTDGSSYIVSSADKWYDRNIKNTYIDSTKLEIHDPRLEKILKVYKFLEVPDYRTTFNKEKSSNTNLQIPVARFPLLEYCSCCGTFNEAGPKFTTKKRPCKYCDKQRMFIQFPIVIMCKAGHIYDFPYFYYTHTKTPRSEVCMRQWLDRSGPSILNWTLKCNCGASHSLTGVTGKGEGNSPFSKEMEGAKCQGKMPWTGGDSFQECEATPVAVLKNALSVYRPETIEALSLTEGLDTFGSNISFEELFHQEFERLNGTIDDRDDKLKVRISFTTEKNKVIKSINYVDRLQQLVVQTNFHRVEPSDDLTSFENASEGPNESLIFSSDYHDRNWYPAKKVYGEGIFIEFNSEVLEEWQDENLVNEHYERLSLRVGEFYLKDRYSSPATILIHTLSHALIKELSRHSGYPMTAIRERLYFEKGSQGLLLYVTDPDKAGTYGGLVRLAREDKFELILNKAISNINWCSSDPVCYEFGSNPGQGIQLSNGSACHNCCFVPSTSCGSRNCFLDRDFLSREKSKVRITKWFDFL